MEERPIISKIGDQLKSLAQFLKQTHITGYALSSEWLEYKGIIVLSKMGADDIEIFIWKEFATNYVTNISKTPPAEENTIYK